VRAAPPGLAVSRAQTVVIEGGLIVAHDGAGHRLLENGVLVYSGDRIVHVGRRWPRPAARRIDARGKLVIPGLISCHAHLASHAGDRLIVDAGRRDLLRSGFLNYEPPRFGGDAFLAAEDPRAAVRYALACLLRHGVTTVVEMGGEAGDAGESVVALAGECGIRLYYGPLCTAGGYAYDEAGRLHRRWDEAGGLRALERAAAFIRRYDGACDGRVRGMLVVSELFNATPTLLRATRRAADALGVGVTLHAAEQLYEFHHVLRTTGMTPVAYLEAHGLLDARLILGHCVYVGGHRLTGYPYRDDLELLARSGATVAHSPLALARRGVLLDSFERYRDHGVALALGTDSYPLDVLSEMRWASLLGKIADRNHEAASARAVFDAATLGGARALARDDLGRLAPGARADIVLVDFSALRIGPVRDPLRALVHCASGDQVDTVIVAGREVVSGGRLLAWDEDEVLAEVCRSTERVWAAFPGYHWAGLGVDEAFPPSCRRWQARVRDPQSGV